MQQIVIALRKRESRAVIEALQDVGVLHLVPVAQGVLQPAGAQATAQDGDYRREAERLLGRVETTIADLGALRKGPAPLPPEDRWATGLDDVAGPASALSKQRQALEADLEVQRTYGEAVNTLSSMVGTLDRSRRVALIPFIYQKPEEFSALQAALHETLEGRFDLATQPLGTAKTTEGNTVGAVAVLTIDRDAARAALGKARVGEIRLPGRFEGMPLSAVDAELTALRDTGAQRLNALDQQRQALADQHGPILFAVRDALADQVALHDVQNLSARGKYSMVMQGYVPEDRLKMLSATLDRFGDAVSYELHPVDTHHAAEVPVELKNSSYSRNFEPVLSLLPLPRYGNFDPTGIISVFFPLFFGFIIADIGYGLLFLMASNWFTGRARRGEGLEIGFMNAYLNPDMLSRLGVIIRTMSLWSIVWGVFTGELFGNLGEHLGLFYHNAGWLQNIWGIHIAENAAAAHHGLIPILFPRLLPEFTNTALITTLLVGMCMVLWAWAIRVQLASRHGHKDHMWEAIGMIGGLVGLISLAFLSQGGNQLMNASTYNFSNPLMIVMVLGFMVFLLGLVLSKAVMMIIEILSQGGNIISFARLFAVGVAGAILANLATDLGWSMYTKLGVLGIIIGIILAVLVHAFALAITIIGHILQPIRLHFVEFLTPTGYHNESGTPYNPLRRLSQTVQSAPQQVQAAVAQPTVGLTKD